MQQQDLGIAGAFVENVPAGDAKIDCALADAGGDVSGALEDDGEAGQGGNVRRVLARVGPVDFQAAGG